MELTELNDGELIQSVHDQIVEDIYQDMKKKKILIQMDEDTELNTFCSLIQTPDGPPSYKEYEKALSTTKKRKGFSLHEWLKV